MSIFVTLSIWSISIDRKQFSWYKNVNGLHVSDLNYVPDLKAFHLRYKVLQSNINFI